MSMLAEPRRKQKVINLRAKNNAWSNDANKFGQRMLEKMGWSSGKGLGANENGIVEHVVARYKNDDKGLGFDDKNDQWTKHEDDFNALLANLSNDTSKEIKLHSGVSLEDKSKKSKARIHYHKFTRGKDLSRYSEKDLANIFGKKSLKIEEKVEEIENNIQTTEQVFTDKGSMEEYFKNKLAAFKSKHPTGLSNQDIFKNDLEYGFRGFEGTTPVEDIDEPCPGFEVQSSSFYNIQNVEGPEKTEEELAVPLKKCKKKKKSKKGHKDKIKSESVSAKTTSVTDTDFNNAVQELEKDLLIKTVKKSKKKSEVELLVPEPEIEAAVPDSTCEPDTEQPVKRKKKKSKPLEVPDRDMNLPKKKKKINKDIEE